MSSEEIPVDGVSQPIDQAELERIRAHLTDLDEFFWVFDPTHSCFIYIGAAFTRVWERSRSPLTRDASSFFEAIHPEDRARIRAAYSQKRVGTYDEIYRVVRPDGSIRIVRDRAFSLLDGAQRVDMMTGLVTDFSSLVTRPRPGENLPEDQRPTIQLDNTQKRYRALFRESFDAAVLLDGHGYIVEVNHEAARLVGLEPHEMIRMHFSSFIDSESLAFAVERWEKVVSGEAGRITLPLQRPDGSSIITEVGARLIHFGPEYVVQLICREVTPQEQLAEELEATRDQLAQVQKLELIGQIAGGVAHDFNNLLSVIMGFADVLKIRLTEQDMESDDADRIIEAGESAALLVRRLLTLARHETVFPQLVEPAALIERVCALLKRALAEGVSLQTEIAADLWQIRIDPVELEQIIMNLTINAADAMPDGGEVLVRATNFVKTPTTADAPADLAFGRYLHIHIKDSGIGMDEGIRARVFEPFFTTKPKARGTGLGLATVQNLVQRNNGHIVLTSKPEEGTTFDIFLPRDER